ncbi:MAG: transporter [Terriglobia bacterium]|nr:MAG: transporter [Terriglobia bacterium]
MNPAKPYFAVLCAILVASPAGLAAPDSPNPPNAASPVNVPQPGPTEKPGFFTRIKAPYEPTGVAPVKLQNSSRLDALMRGGTIYLSLQDAMALVLENNLDIEVQRYGSQVADVNLMRSRAGGFAAPVSVAVTPGPGSVTGAPPSAGLQAFIVAPATQIGPVIPNLDPALVSTATWAHQTTPQSSNFVTGTAALIQRQDLSNVTIQKYFTTGTQVSLGLNNNHTLNNNSRAQFNPATNSNLALNFTQHLLQGFGPSLNTRQIRIAKNNREVSDLTFKAQVIATVSAVKNLYWDLLSYQQNVRVQQDALDVLQRLYDDNKKQVEVGTMAPIEVTRAEAEIAAGQQALTIAQTQELQQETILKNALSRNGVQSAAIAEARVILTDRIRVPDVEAVTPIQDAVAMAMAARPELSQFRILMQNQEIALKGVKNGLLPALDVVANFANNGLAGQPVPLPASCASNPNAAQCVPPNGFFSGGYGDVLSQLFARNFPTYSAGFSLTIPIRNRAAQADVIGSELVVRQQELGMQRMQNQVRVEVQNAMIGLQQARAQYQSAGKQLLLQQQTVDAEQKKLALGASTTYNVILTQRDLVTAESNQVAAESAYAKAKVEMDRATGQTLNNNDISIDEAFRGVVSRPPSAIPDVPPAQNPRP